MVSLEKIHSSNSKISTALQPGLVAVFAGATSGIGETSLKHFAKHAVRPRIYFIGRSKESGSRIHEELQKLNPDGEYIYKSVDVSLLRSVDDASREIQEKETSINILFLSTGTMLSWKGGFVKATGEMEAKVDTEEGLHYPVAVSYYARFRFIVNLLPLLQKSTSLRRVVTVLAGTKEGQIDTNAFQSRNGSMLSLRGHFSSMMTFALEAVAKSAPGVSFIHVYPGFVKSNHGNDVKGLLSTILRVIFNAVFMIVAPFIATPLEETGERHIFFATSAMFPPEDDGAANGVPIPDGVAVAQGTDGRTGSGVYSIANDGETASPNVEKLLRNLREDGTAQKVWSQVEEELFESLGPCLCRNLRRFDELTK